MNRRRPVAHAMNRFIHPTAPPTRCEEEGRVEMGVKAFWDARRRESEGIGKEWMGEDMVRHLNTYALKSKRVPTVTGRMVLNATFLLERERRADFYDCIEWLNQKYAGILKLECSGPRPVHKFGYMRTPHSA